MEFQSDIIIGDTVITVAPKTSSVSSLDSAKQSAEKSEVDVHVKNKTKTTCCNESDNILCSEGVSAEKKEVLQETGLKSSLKTSRSKWGSRSVKWADEREKEVPEDKRTDQKSCKWKIRIAPFDLFVLLHCPKQWRLLHQAKLKLEMQVNTETGIWWLSYQVFTLDMAYQIINFL